MCVLLYGGSDAFPVGAGLPAMEVNDDEGCPDERGVLTFFAGKPAPTGEG
jgi:hypothetical protein